MDAFAFGTKAKPVDAFAFARGQKPQTLPDGTIVKQSRPLDFTAVTDHAETFDVMHICTETHHGQNYEYCRDLVALSGVDSANSLKAFREYLLPVIAGDKPKPASLCSETGIDCEVAALEQWQKSQDQANAANDPCKFTAFVGYEWSATPNASHWHRNLIFKSKSVTFNAIDYVNFPSPDKLWSELDYQCRAERGCEVIAIPHNTNLSEGGGFDVENSSEAELFRRAKYERLIEINQSKGTSECLNENWDDFDSDCGFETYLLPKTKAALLDDPLKREQFNRSFARNILSRGLLAYKNSGDTKLDPLQLGIIASTDNHTATPGYVEEQEFKGDAWGSGDRFKDKWLGRLDYNQGGLVAVWADQNTRDSIFGALKNRRAYGTSGTRILLRFVADTTPDPQDRCAGDFSGTISMGSSFSELDSEAPQFTLIAKKDVAPLVRAQIIKGTIKNGAIEESVTTVFDAGDGIDDVCKSWSDPDFDKDEPAYWYLRVEEVATQRWSKTVCNELENCEDYPGADRMIRERAWSSPIWYFPK